MSDYPYCSRIVPVLLLCDFVYIFAASQGCSLGINHYNMAIISSMGVGRARKSMGNVTYRTVRGRTIGSQKRTATGGAATRGEGQVLSYQQALFGMVSMFMQAHGGDIDVSFNKSRYGSQRNYFFKKNKSSLFKALQALASVAVMQGYPTLTEIEEAITTYATANPTAIVRVSLQGFDVVYLTGAWTSDDNPVSGGGASVIGTGTVVTESSNGIYTYTAPAAALNAFRAGAKIVRTGGTTKMTIPGIPAGLTTGTIKFLTNDGNIVSGIAVTEVVSSTEGSVTYNSPALEDANNVVAVQLGGVFVRLTSAYVRTGEQNPLG